MNFLRNLFKKESKLEQIKKESILSKTKIDEIIGENEISMTPFPKNILPKLNFGWEFLKKQKTVEGDEIELSGNLLPVIKRIGETSLSVILVKDENQMVEWVKKKELDGIDINKGIEKSFKNLLEIYSNIGIGNVETESQEIGKIGMIVNASMYCGSLILLEQIWEQIFNFLGTKEVHFIVPNSRHLMFCDAKNIKGNGYLFGNAKHLYNSSFDKLSEFVYYKKEGVVVKELNDDEIEMDV